MRYEDDVGKIIEETIGQKDRREAEERWALTEKRNELIGKAFLIDDPDGPDLTEKLRRQAVALDTLFQHYVVKAQGHDNQHYYIQAFRSQQQYCKTVEVLQNLEKANELKENKNNRKITKKRLSKREDRTIGDQK